MTTNGWQVAAGLLAATAVLGGCSGEAAGKRPATVTVTVPVPVTASPVTVTALPSPATVTALPSPATSSTTTPSGPTFTDPLVMVAKVKAAGVALVNCDKPLYNITGGLSVRCITPDVNEGVDFSVFDRPEDQATSVRMAVAQGGKAHEGPGWTVEVFHRQATLDKVIAALLG